MRASLSDTTNVVDRTLERTSHVSGHRVGRAVQVGVRYAQLGRFAVASVELTGVIADGGIAALAHVLDDLRYDLPHGLRGWNQRSQLRRQRRRIAGEDEPLTSH
jgi:hypothetical protein